MTQALATSTPPATIAHRAGNTVSRLREAEARGLDHLETDVWLHRGRLEVRHEKTAGPLPFLWDRWSLSSARSQRFLLSELFTEANAQSRLLLDLKGVNRHLPLMIKRQLYAQSPTQPIAICSQNWPFVDAFADIAEIERLYSIGSINQLRAWFDNRARANSGGISIDARLLDAAIVQRLRETAVGVVPWRVLTLDHADQLLAWGVTGINADDYQMLERLKSRSKTIHGEPISCP